MIPTNEVITAVATEKYGAVSADVLIVGFVTMLALGWFTPLKYVFPTGHHMVFMSVLLAVVLSVGFGEGLAARKDAEKAQAASIKAAKLAATRADVTL